MKFFPLDHALPNKSYTLYHILGPIFETLSNSVDLDQMQIRCLIMQLHSLSIGFSIKSLIRPEFFSSPEPKAHR